MSLDDLVFVGFNSRVLALDRETGEIVWQWKASVGGYVTLLFDVDRLIVSVNGYLFCLDPLSGEQLWYNPTKGCGCGVASIATARSATPHEVVIDAVLRQAQDNAGRSHSFSP